MKNYKKLIVCLIALSIIVSCSNGIEHTAEIEDELGFIKVNTKSGVIDNSTLNNLFSGSRSLEDGSNGIPEELNEGLIAFFETLTEEEKEQFLSSHDISIEATLEIEEEDANRGIIGKEELEVLLLEKEIEGLLDTAFFGKTVSNYTYIINNNPITIETTVFAGYVATALVQNQNWEKIEELILDLNVNVNLKNIKKLKIELEAKKNIDASSGRSLPLADTHYESKLNSNMASYLQNGYVLIPQGRKTSSGSFIGLGVGYYGHVGLFDRDGWITGGRNDDAHSVLSSQPNENGDLNSKVRAEHSGYNTREPLNYYNYSKRVKVIKPEGYTSANAKIAVDYAKGYIDRSNRAKFNLPYGEAFIIGTALPNSSHNGNLDDWPYCSKIAYASWKKAGKNIDSDDSNLNRGALITPDDIANSTIDRYITYKIKFAFWTKTFKVKVYEDTSDTVKTFTR